jgi:hypothetical protein
MRTRQFGYLTYFADFGGAIAFETSERVDFSPSLLPAYELDSYGNFFNATFRIGLGAEYDLGGSTAIIAGLHYHRSLIDNLKAGAPGLNKESNYRFDYVALTLGILF